MRFAAILNRDGGTLKTTDMDALSAHLRGTLQAAGHTVNVAIVSGGEIAEALADAASVADIDVVMAGGGDGTVSTAAGCLMGTDKALAVLPAGTMNLFARSLAVPASIDAAVVAFADGEIRAVDVATANGKAFVHQFSVGMHAKMVHLRDKMEFGSRWGKIGASIRATYMIFLRPPSLRVSIERDGEEAHQSVTAVGITNNLLQEGTLPYAEKPDGGVLGVYVTRARRRPELVSFFLNLLRLRWGLNPHVDVHDARRVVLKILSHEGKPQSVIDGELANLTPETVIEIHPRALKVLVPLVRS